MPSFEEESLLQHQGYRFTAGVDEAGRGSLAGPVVAAAVILPCGADFPFMSRVRDSKKLTPSQRESLFDYILKAAVSTGVGMVDYDRIDSVGILEATRLAMKQAIASLSPPADSLLIDYVHLSGIAVPQKSITRGDDLCYSIACASIIAKVSRDRLMVELDEAFPGYGLARHKGYGTRDHLACLQKLGPSPVHRRSFAPVSQMRFMEPA